MNFKASYTSGLHQIFNFDIWEEQSAEEVF